MFNTIKNAIANIIYNSSNIKSEDERRAAMLNVYRSVNAQELEQAYTSMPEYIQVEIASSLND